MNSPMTRANRAAMAMPSHREKAPTRRASSRCPRPSSREIRDPPPTPARPARHRVMLNTGRISEVPATM